MLSWGSSFSSIPFFFFLLGLHISMGLDRFPVLRIGSDPTEVSDLGRTGGESDGLAVVVHRGVPREPPLPLGKGKGKISEIQYPSGSEYLRAAIQNAEIFVTQYGSLLGVQVSCPDVLTTYVIQVPKMICFFEVAFENGLHFP